MALVLETLRSNKTLDLGGLGVGLCALLLGDDFTANDELADLDTQRLVLKPSNFLAHFLLLRLNALLVAG